MLVVGIGHRREVGKDTFAHMLKGHLRCRTKIRSFAWKLKQIAYELYEWAGHQRPQHYDEHRQDRDVILSRIGKSPRQIWIELGTTAVREQVYEHTWVDYLLESRHSCDVLIVPDVRFPDEAERIQAVGLHSDVQHGDVRRGCLLNMTNPRAARSDDVADTAMSGFTGWDKTIVNDGTLSDLDDQALKLARELEERFELPVPRFCTEKTLASNIAAEA